MPPNVPNFEDTVSTTEYRMVYLVILSIKADCVEDVGVWCYRENIRCALSLKGSFLFYIENRLQAGFQYSCHSLWPQKHITNQIHTF